MVRAGARLAGALAAAVTMVAAILAPVGADASEVPPDAGPDSCPGYITALFQHGPRIGLKDSARFYRTKCGLRYRAGQQDSHLVITQVGKKLRFADRGTKRVDKLARNCKQLKVKRGILVECTIPARFSEKHRMLIEVWPRLGDDFVDGSTLSARFSMAVLADDGDDTALLGAGPDFFNGTFGHDYAEGGGGNDWIRTDGGRDRIKGGPGRDFLNSGPGRDVIDGGQDADKLYCGPGRDRGLLDHRDDKPYSCEIEKVSYK